MGAAGRTLEMKKTGTEPRVKAPKKRKRSGEAAEEDGAPPPSSDLVTLANVVITASLQCTLDLQEIAWRYNGEHNPNTFAAVQLRLPRPRITALVFSSGKIVATGAKNEHAAEVGLYIFYYMLWKVNPEARLERGIVQNIVSSGFLGANVRIDDMHRAISLSLQSHYEPEIFPGFRLQIRDPSLKALVFAAGKVVLTGGKTREDIRKAWAILRKVVEKYQNFDESTEHIDIISLRAADRKRGKV